MAELQTSRLLKMGWLVLLGLWFSGVLRAGADLDDRPQPAASVLILNSYHPGHLWADAETDGVRQVLRREAPHAELFVEYIDRRRNPATNHLDRVAEFLRAKHGGRAFAVILALDQHALDLLVAHRDSLFPATPVVFCGVETIPVMKPAVPRWFTGVIERLDLAGTVQLAQRLQPELNRVLLFQANPEAAHQLRHVLLSQAPGLDLRFRVEVLTNAPVAELFKTLESLDLTTAVLVGSSPALHEVQGTLNRHSRAPFYGTQSPNQLGACLGGHFSDGAQQGIRAAQMVLRILGGEQPDQIPLLANPPPRRLVDCTEMKRLGLPLARVPADVELLNAPPNPWTQHRQLILILIVGSGILGAALVLLAILLRQRRSAELALSLSEERYRLLLENSLDLMLEVTPEGRLVFVSPNAPRLLGYQPAEVLGREVFELVHPDDLRQAREAFHGTGHTATVRVRHRDGTSRWMEATGRSFRNPDGAERLVLVARDVHQRVLAEESRRQLEDSLRQARKS